MTDQHGEMGKLNSSLEGDSNFMQQISRSIDDDGTNILFFLDRDGRIVSSNISIELLKSFWPEGIYGMNFLELLSANDQSDAAREKAITSLMVNGHSYHAIGTIDSKDHSPLSVGIATLRDAEDQICGFGMMIMRNTDFVS